MPTLAGALDDHPLVPVLLGAAAGRFPPPDGVIELLAPDAAGTEAVVELTGHAYVLTGWSEAAGLYDGRTAFGDATDPRALAELAGPGGVIGSHDLVMVRRAGPTPTPATLERPLPETDRYDDHPRVRRARHHRRGVRVFGDERGLVTLGRGLVGRTEVSVELTGGRLAPHTGRRLVLGALAHLPHDEWVFAQVAAGNAASVRAFLGCGFVPIGSEVLLEPDER